MTVHGAKGLEAPIVFLPDTCTTRSARPPSGLLVLDDAVRPSAVPPPFLWPVKGTSKVAAVQQAKARIARCGDGRAQPPALRGADARARPAVRGGLRGRAGAARRLLVQSDQGWPRRASRRKSKQADGRVVWRLASEQTTKPEPAKRAVALSAGVRRRCPRGRSAKAPREPLITMPLAPSRLAPLEMRSGGRAASSGRKAPALPSRPSCRRPRWPTMAGSCAARSRTPCSSTCRRCRSESWRAAAKPSWPSRAAQLPAQVRKGIVAETLAVLRRSRLGAAVRPRQPRRGGDCRRGAASRAARARAAADRQDRSPGARRRTRC